jgi:hypothetical protein
MLSPPCTSGVREEIGEHCWVKSSFSKVLACQEISTTNQEAKKQSQAKLNCKLYLFGSFRMEV